LHDVRGAGEALGAGAAVNLLDLALAGGDVDADGSLRLAEFGQESNRAVHRRVGSQVVVCGGLGNRLSVFAHTGNVQHKSFSSHSMRLFQGGTGSNAAGKVWEADPVVRVFVFMKVGNVFHDLSIYTNQGSKIPQKDIR
jgi:hypothetical protein